MCVDLLATVVTNRTPAAGPAGGWKCVLTEAARSPEGYTFCVWAWASCSHHSSLYGASWCRLSFGTHTWCIESLQKSKCGGNSDYFTI